MSKSLLATVLNAQRDGTSVPKGELCSRKRLWRAHLVLLLLLHLLLVEHELFTLQDVAVGASALPRAGGDRRQEAEAILIDLLERANKRGSSGLLGMYRSYVCLAQ